MTYKDSILLLFILLLLLLFLICTNERYKIQMFTALIFDIRGTIGINSRLY